MAWRRAAYFHQGGKKNLKKTLYLYAALTGGHDEPKYRVSGSPIHTLINIFPDTIPLLFFALQIRDLDICCVHNQVIGRLLAPALLTVNCLSAFMHAGSAVPNMFA